MHQILNSSAGNEWAKNLPDIFGWSRPFIKTLVPAKIFELLKQANFLEDKDGVWLSRIRVSNLDGLLFIHSIYLTVQTESVFFGPDTYRFTAAIKIILLNINIQLKESPIYVLVAEQPRYCLPRCFHMQKSTV